jgi:hypothetical protein
MGHFLLSNFAQDCLSLLPEVDASPILGEICTFRRGVDSGNLHFYVSFLHNARLQCRTSLGSPITWLTVLSDFFFKLSQPSQRAMISSDGDLFSIKVCLCVCL